MPARELSLMGTSSDQQGLGVESKEDVAAE
jgi:hypothetical protein